MVGWWQSLGQFVCPSLSCLSTWPDFGTFVQRDASGGEKEEEEEERGEEEEVEAEEEADYGTVKVSRSEKKSKEPVASYAAKEREREREKEESADDYSRSSTRSEGGEGSKAAVAAESAANIGAALAALGGGSGGEKKAKKRSVDTKICDPCLLVVDGLEVPYYTCDCVKGGILQECEDGYMPWSTTIEGEGGLGHL